MGMFDRTPNRGWYTVDFLAAASQSINLRGRTQFRLRFSGTPGQDAARAYIKFYSGAEDASNSPILMVKYSLP